MTDTTSRHRLSLFYKPDDGWVGDVIPFYWQGEYHLFYLKKYRDPERHGAGTPWWHIGTRDFVTFTDYGEALPRGSRDDQDSSVATGCVVERDGLFHIFYTGFALSFRDTDGPEQAVMHAVSDDLCTWTKIPEDTFCAPQDRYEKHDWRDPYVFWNAEADEYWMLIAARLNRGPSGRRGCLALAASNDLTRWEIREPFWAPYHHHAHECPDLFRMGDWWYLVYSSFSERMVTHYRMSHSLAGPWLAPANDSLDGRALYAAKTASDGHRRFAFGWNPSRAEEQDTGRWEWGGSLVVHEVVAAADGSLAVRMPPELAGVFTSPVPLQMQPELGQWKSEGDTLTGEAGDAFAWCRLGIQPSTAYLAATVTLSPGTRAGGLLLRADSALERYYQVRLEPGRERVVFDRWPRPGDEPFMIERPLRLTANSPVRLRVLIEDSVVVVYANDEIAMSARACDRAGSGWGVFVSEGAAIFTDLAMTARTPL
jgi:beta-fructofuranosidase